VTRRKQRDESLGSQLTPTTEEQMRLLPEEEERLQIFLAAQLARRRRDRGLKLSYPEAVALICDEVMEAARDGKSYDAACDLGYTVLTADDVMEGVPELMDRIHVEALFDEGTLMVSLYSPLGSGPDGQEPAAAASGVIVNEDREQLPLVVTNMLDRAVQVTSHYHFFEVTRGLVFDRAQAYGMRLDIAAGTSVRFEPGESLTVPLIGIGGRRVVYGHAGLVNGALDDEAVRREAFAEASRRGYETMSVTG
jgi:urease subunit gamma/beta